MPVTITRTATYSSVQGPASGDNVSGASLVTQTIQPLANSDEYMRQILEVTGVRKVQGLSPLSMAGPAPTPVSGIEAFIAVDSSNRSLWIYDSSATDTALSNVCIVPSSGAGRWLNVSAILVPGQRFRGAQRVNVNVPLSSMTQRFAGSSGATQLDGTNFSVVNTGLLNGFQKMSTNIFANFSFRTRLPRGKLVGASLVMVPNGSAAAAPGTTSTTIVQPLRMLVRTVKGSQDVVAAGGIYTYDTSAGLINAVTTVWTGTCGVAGNPLNSSAVWSEQIPKLFNFAENTTSTNSSTTGGTAGVNVSADREYIFTVLDATFAGSDYVSLWTNGLQPIVYRLEAWIDITDQGAG